MNFKSYFLTALLGCGAVASYAEFKGFEVVLNNQTGTILTADEQVQGTAVEFGVAVDEAGATTRVEKDDASSVATISGQYHSDHGLTGLKVIVPVEGSVAITVGQCTYSGNDIVVKNSDGETVVTKTPTAQCWKNNRANVTELYYTGEATTLTITGPAYCAYVAVSAVTTVVTKYDIRYSLGEETAEGTVPATTTWTEGDSYTIPQNFTLYKDGYTLTGWSDGTTTYALGAAYIPVADVTLTPVFTKNTKTLADRTTDLTLLWDFQRKNGAPTIAVEGSGNGIGVWVTQVEVAGETIDVKLDYDATSGKIANAKWTDWAQLNNGTKLTIPSAKGAVVSIEAYNALSSTTIEGSTGYTSDKIIDYTVTGDAETVDIVISNDGTYYRTFQIVLPAITEYTATIGSLGVGTLCLPQAVSVPEGVKAYVGAYDAEASVLTLTEVSIIPAGTGVVIEGATGSYTFPVTTATTTATSDLQGNPWSLATTASDGIICVLDKVNDQIGFYKWTGEIPAHKAYLPLSSSNEAPVIRIQMGDETGNVSAIETINAETAIGGRMFDLSGRVVKGHVATGLYIVGGKKVWVK